MRPDLRQRWAVIAVIVLAALVAVIGWQTWQKASRPTDFAMYLEASRAHWSGGDPYAVGEGAPFIYPLFLCVIMWPFWHLPLAANVATWFVLSVAAAASAIAIFAKLHEHLGTHRLLVAIAIVSVFLADVVQSNLRNGQVNFVVLFACAAFAWYWVRNRGWVSSAWLGAAIALKITPALFLVFLAVNRQWRRLGEAVAFAAVFSHGLPWLVAGSRAWSDTRGDQE